MSNRTRFIIVSDAYKAPIHIPINRITSIVEKMKMGSWDTGEAATESIVYIEGGDWVRTRETVGQIKKLIEEAEDEDI